MNSLVGQIKKKDLVIPATVAATAAACAAWSFISKTYLWKDYSQLDDSKITVYKKDFKKDIVYVYGFSKIAGIHCSPFVFKLMAWLDYAEIPYEVVRGDHRGKNPRNKLPFVELNGHTITDSALIIAQLSRHFGKHIDADLTTEEAAISLAVIRMLEDHFNYTMVYYRWKYPSGFKQFFSYLPIPETIFGPVIQASVVSSLYAQGMGRHTDENVLLFAKEDLKAVSDLLGEHKYFFGKSKPHLVDLVLYAALGCQQLTVDTPHNELVESGFPNLTAFRVRMEQQLPINDKKK